MFTESAEVALLVTGSAIGCVRQRSDLDGTPFDSCFAEIPLECMGHSGFSFITISSDLSFQYPYNLYILEAFDIEIVSPFVGG